MDKTQKLVFSMLMENTGIAMMDSGGDDGRAWQRNQKRDLKAEPSVSVGLPLQYYTLTHGGEFVRRSQSENELLEYMQKNTSYSWEHAFKHEGWKIEKEKNTSADIDVLVSLYHYLPTVLELDELCDEYNALRQADWDSETYGVSAKGEKWLQVHGFTIGQSWNSYNGENNLSQVLQGTELKRDGLGEGDYVLLQVHGGADVRGGYTDAKLFKYQRFQEMIDWCPPVYATLTRANGDTVELQTSYNGHSFTTEDGKVVDILEGDTIRASL